MERDIIIDCIAEQLLIKQEELANRKLYSIDVLSLAGQLLDSFETLCTVGLAFYQIAEYRNFIKNNTNQKGISLDDEDIDIIIKKIKERQENLNK